MQSQTFPSSTELLNRSWDQIKNQLPLTAGLTLVFVMGVAGAGSIEVFGWFLGIFISAGYTACLLRLRAGAQFDFNDFLWAFKNFSRVINLVLATFLKTALLIAGLICFVIPGIFVMVATSLTDVLLVKNDLDGVAAIKKSMALIKGNWWSMAGVLAVVLLLNIVGLLCFLIGVLVTIPLSFLILIETVEALEKSSGQGPTMTPSSFVPVNPT